MVTISESMSRGRSTATTSWWTRAAVISGPLFLGIAALLVFWFGPMISESDAPAKIKEFYSNGDSDLLLIAEPLALVGMFSFLWLVGRIRAGIAQRNESWAGVAFGGGIAFAVLAGASLTAHTTVAGTAAFSSSFEVDPNTAMLFSHLGYVLLAGAMIGAAVMAFAAARTLRVMGRPGLMRATYAVGGLSLIANLFVYVPLVAYLIWTVVVGLVLNRAGQDRAGSEQE